VDTLRRDITDTTVQAIISWLSWITEQECQQLIRPPLPYRLTQCMQHLQVTYEAQTSHTDWPQKVMDAASHQERDQKTPSTSSVEVTDTCTDIQGKAWTDAEPPAQETLNLTNGDRSACRLNRLTAVTHGNADHIPQLQAASLVDPSTPENSDEGKRN
jgi:hypothetical protein